MYTAAKRPVLAGGLIILATLLAYVPALRGGFIWDDDSYVTENDTLTSLEGLGRIWFELGATPQYYPMVHASFWIEYHLWELAPFGYHLVNVLLHVASAVLLWRILHRLGVPGAWFAAAIFAVHPVHVESVAWITERKNVLSGLFCLGAAWAYLRFRPLDEGLAVATAAGTSDVGASDAGRWRFYALAAVLFLCALLSKTVACTLPAALLLIVWWKRGRLGRGDLLPLIPLLIVGIALGLVTVWMEKHRVGAEGEEWALSFVERSLLAARVLWFYLGKLAWPAGLTFTYPRWEIDSGIWWQFLYPLATAVVVIACWSARRRLGRGPLVALLFFGGTLFPALGFFDVYPMRYSFVADHFQYLASIGPIALFTALWARLVATRRPASENSAGMAWNARALTICRLLVPLILLAALGSRTWQQGRIYKDVETLWRDTLAKNPSAWMAHTNLANRLLARDEIEAAKEHYAAAIEANPRFAEAHVGMGSVLARQGQINQAIAHYQTALRLRPDMSAVHNNLASIFLRQGRFDEGIESLNRALQLNADDFVARRNLGVALALQGRVDEAVAAYRRAIESRPLNSTLYRELGDLLHRDGRLDEAVRVYRQALGIDPHDQETRRALDNALAEREKQ